MPGDEAVLAAVDGSFDHLLLAGRRRQHQLRSESDKGDGTEPAPSQYCLQERPTISPPYSACRPHRRGMPGDTAGRIHAMDLRTGKRPLLRECLQLRSLHRRIPENADPHGKTNSLGKIAHYINGIGDLPRFRRWSSPSPDGGDFRGNAIIFFVFNGRTAGTLPLAYLSEGDDGLLDILVLKGDTPLDTLHTAIVPAPAASPPALPGRHRSHPVQPASRGVRQRRTYGCGRPARPIVPHRHHMRARCAPVILPDRKR